MLKNILLNIIFVVACLTIYTIYFINSHQNNTTTQSPTFENLPDDKNKTNNDSNQTQPTQVSLDEQPATKGANYFEKIVKVGTEYIYFALPLSYSKENPPKLIVYSHGSNTTVSKNLSDPFMKDMQMYGKYFTNHNFGFAASSMHGVNWGSDQSVQDNYDLVQYISKRYELDKKVNLLGFSMGGLPTLNYVFKYPQTVNSVALLAPTSRSYTQVQLKSIRKIPIHIWHGDKDVNVPLSLSTTLVNTNKSLGYDNMTLTVIPNKTHFDLDTEYKSDVLNFFLSHE